MDAKEKLIFAMDVDSMEKAEGLAQKIGDYIGMVKVNSLYVREGPNVIGAMNKYGIDVFLDLKFHDIPNTVANHVAEATKLGVKMMTVHASGSYPMMNAAAESAKETSEKLGIEKPYVLGITVLTSFDEDELRRMGITDRSLEEHVGALARLAKGAGLDGVVASAKETPYVRKVCGRNFLIVTPGIRPEWAAANDQKRITTPRQAIEYGADYLVVGRPIRSAENPAEAAQKILYEIEGR